MHTGDNAISLHILCPIPDSTAFPALITLVPGLLSNAPSARRRKPPRFWQTINVSSGHATVDCHPNVFILHTRYNSLLCVPAVQRKSHRIEENPGSPKHYTSDVGQALQKSASMPSNNCQAISFLTMK
jgi:hypothetical protein